MNHTKADISSQACEETLSFLLDIIREGVWDWDANSGHVARSPGWYRMLGYEVGCFEENVMTWENVIHPDDYPNVMRHFEAYISGASDHYDLEYRCRMANGDYKWIRDQGKIVARNRDGSVARMIGAHLDIHEQKVAQQALERQNRMLQQDNFTLESLIAERTVELEKLNARLKEKVDEASYLATTDQLTHLHNRYSFESELEREMARAQRYSSPMSITLFDIDFFKAINDNFGHSAGDNVLARVGDAIRHCTRKTDIAARWGGDEFAIIFPEADLQHAVSITEKLLRCLQGITLADDTSLSSSFGVTQYVEGDSRDTMMWRADKALYAAKSGGRGAVMVN
jgi:diguanylate cyclase (GGDEF)-like protein/PAS domain S-box-containing protein